jgi:hypothetical protein
VPVAPAPATTGDDAGRRSTDITTRLGGVGTRGATRQVRRSSGRLGGGGGSVAGATTVAGVPISTGRRH